MTNYHDKFKTEYSSNYVWHDNAYTNKPERLHYIRGRIRNGTLFSRHKGSLQQLSQPQLTQLQHQQQLWKSVLHLPLHPSPRRLVEVVEKETHEDENQIKLSSKKQSTRQKQRRASSSTRRYSLEADARGIKSHFLPASLDVLLDLGISSYKSTTTSGDGGGDANEGSQSFAEMVMTTGTGDSEKCGGGNQYFTSVYKKDFSCTDKPDRT